MHIAFPTMAELYIDPEQRERVSKQFFYFSMKTYVVGTH